jgi:hypothetical protein
MLEGASSLDDPSGSRAALFRLMGAFGVTPGGTHVSLVLGQTLAALSHDHFAPE